MTKQRLTFDKSWRLSKSHRPKWIPTFAVREWRLVGAISSGTVGGSHQFTGTIESNAA